MAKISFYTIGCKLNQAESDEIANQLQKKNYQIVDFKKPADIAVIRACAVTKNASQTTREMIRQAKRRGSFVIVGGCLENRNLPEIDFISQTPGDIIDKINQLSKQKKNHSKKTTANKKTRCFIKIQSGCNFNCAYCVITKFRGKSVSISDKKIISQINERDKEGLKEIVLTGVNICQYKWNKLDLPGLINEILNNTKIERIRLGSLDPRLINAELINLYPNDRLMPHWHLSLQSGSDSVLKRMNRGYDSKKYFEIVKAMKKKYPLFSFTTDIIVGFPGETEKEFIKTIKFINQIGFSKIHIFPYSPRPNTDALKIKPQIQNSITTERCSLLKKESEAVAEKYLSKFIGQKREILFEQKKTDYWIGYSPEYFQIKYKSSKNLKNKIANIKLTKSNIIA